MEANQSLFDRILRQRVLSHFLFWTALVLTNIAWQSLVFGGWRNNLVHHLFILPVQLGAAYTLVYFQLPRWYLRKRYFAFFLSLLASLYLFGALGRIAIVYGAEPFTRVDFTQESIQEILSDPLYLLMGYIPSVYLFTFWLIIAQTIKDRFEVRHQLEVIKKEKAQAELKLLKAQIHPHFLFNTLNNLYALSLNKSDQAPEVVAKLSDLLSYILYECNTPKVSLRKEMELIQNYMDLEQLRYGDQLDLDFQQRISNEQAQIAPLILISLIENAFKHGASKNLEYPKVHILAEQVEQHFTLSVLNSKATSSVQDANDANKGLGLANLRRQLDLIYPKRYNLAINDTDDSYFVKLSITLD